MTARNPDAVEVTPLSHVAKKRQSPRISTTKLPEITFGKYNEGNGVATINLEKIPGEQKAYHYRILGMKHSSPEVLEALDLAWDDESGFLGLLRAGNFSQSLAEDYLSLLNSIEIDEGEAFHQDFVRLIWFAPIFMEWQVERTREAGADERGLTNAVDRIRERIMELLGTP
ncbi:hypothetical protein [Streptomyces sp. XD-27]|uniref:hypothetical protein n=1 Tax=Streptomyces sp. XD-27 TaxID=3062779 RepID=UPI0026F47B08|nr:hypothetical protein [Streptomyces sp. XD-27]WKX70644.1 hypothetical protein Q3Y56_12625 [Streptomyces sp. XD-27]